MSPFNWLRVGGFLLAMLLAYGFGKNQGWSECKEAQQLAIMYAKSQQPKPPRPQIKAPRNLGTMAPSIDNPSYYSGSMIPAVNYPVAVPRPQIKARPVLVSVIEVEIEINYEIRLTPPPTQSYSGAGEPYKKGYCDGIVINGGNTCVPHNDKQHSYPMPAPMPPTVRLQDITVQTDNGITIIANPSPCNPTTPLRIYLQ